MSARNRLHRRRRAAVATVAALSLVIGGAALSAQEASPDDLLALLTDRNARPAEIFDRLDKGWQPSLVPMVIEAMFFVRAQKARGQFVDLLKAKTGHDGGFDVQAWYDWLWSIEDRPDHPRYAEFKSKLYALIDPKFAGYFANDRVSKIRLDEVRWGGVKQDGIPPLRQPKMIPASAATYLSDDNIIFGLEINGDARAYPKRILAWHEMFVDTVGGVEVAGVYCTLCGSMVLFETEVDGVNHQLGTSGFLFRSNKLMYDQATQTLWNTLWGTPVIGPLAEQEIELPKRSVVTTTWKEWQRRHPKTQVLSLDTGHQRDYSEGAAYRDYFSTDKLMFGVPKVDKRLKNKDEVLALTFPEQPGEALAIASKYLRKNDLHHDSVGSLELVVLTDRSGAHRVYETGGLEFKSWNKKDQVTAADGSVWTLTEDELLSPDGKTLDRLASHNAFWFGWYAANPHTRLVH